MRIMKVAAMLALMAPALPAQVQQPLEASLRRGAFEALFYVNQPAYVAVFEVLPGAGVQQLYPRTSQQATVATSAGEYLLSRPFRSGYSHYASWNANVPYARPVYMVDAAGRVVSYYYTTAYRDIQLAPSRTLLLVASKHPLRRVTSPEAADFWMQQVVGFRAVSSTLFANESMLRDIADAVTPLGVDPDDVVIDVIDIMDDQPRFVSQNVQFICADGVHTVSAEFFFSSGTYFCPQQVRKTAAQVPVPVPGDSTIVNEEDLKKPGRKVPPVYIAEEAMATARKVGTVSNATIPSDEGFALHRRGVSPTGNVLANDDGMQGSRRVHSVPVTGGQATISTNVPMATEGFTARSVGRVGAWVPPSAGLPAEATGYGAGRYTSTNTGYESAVQSRSTHTTTTNGFQPPSQSNPTTTSAPVTESMAAARSAITRTEVQAARPTPPASNPPSNPNP